MLSIIKIRSRLRTNKGSFFRAEKNILKIYRMIEEYSTCVTRGREWKRERRKKRRKKRKKENPMVDRDHRRVVKPVVLFPPRGPLCLSPLDFRLSHFPLSLRISPDPLPAPPPSSPRVRHFCLYFVVIVDRKRTSAP